MSNGKKAPLAGLEPTAEVLFSTDAGERQASRRESGEDLAAALLDGRLAWASTDEGPAVVNVDTGEIVEDRSAAFAALLAFAADESNHVTGALEDDHGGTYPAGAALWKSSLRLDPNWMETMRRRSRNRAHAAVKRMMEGLSQQERLARKYGWAQRLTMKLITLTMPHHAGTSSFQETQRLNRALTLLKKRQWWRRTMAGGIKGVEDALDFDGPHVHAHMLMLSTFIDRKTLASEWRECLEDATRWAYGFGLSEDFSPVLDVRQVKRKPGGRQDAVSWEDALSEVTKYVTKPADFLKRDAQGRRVPREVLIDICEVRRWPRMFELLGRCREAMARVTSKDKALAAAAALDSIHRAYLTGQTIKVPDCLGWEVVEAWDHETDGPEEKRKMIVMALLARERAGPKVIRPPSWRDLLDQISLPEWLGIMADRFRRGKAFRIRQILDANPTGYLVTMSGQAFGCVPECLGVA